jgi:hypothetical protein
MTTRTWHRAEISSATTTLPYRSPLDSPVVAGLTALVGGLVFVVARLIVAAHGNVTVFIVAGSDHVLPGRGVGNIFIGKGQGYDGQFYYRMALDPGNLSRTAFGIRLDTIFRLGRIGYPTIAWLLAAGRRSLVADSLVATNVIALGVLGYAGGLLARQSGRHALWGLALAGYWGYLWSAGRDLTEITAAAFLVLGLVAYRQARPVWAGLALLGAVLSKETAAYVVAILAVTRILGWLARREPRHLGAADVAWALPLAGFCAWQGTVFAATGTIPLRASGDANLGLPFVGMVDGLRHYLPDLPSRSALLWVGELGVLGVLALAALIAVRRSSAPTHEKLAWLAVVTLAVCAAKGIWMGDVGFRSLDYAYLFSWIVLLGTPKRLWIPGAIVAVTWLGVAVELVKFV